MAQLCVKKMATAENRQVMVLGAGLRQGMRKLDGTVLVSTLSQVARELGRGLLCQCGGRLRYQRMRETKLESLFGGISYTRSYYAECQCEKGRSPLDDEFGLKPGEITPGLGRLLALVGSGLAFGESVS